MTPEQRQELELRIAGYGDYCEDAIDTAVTRRRLESVVGAVERMIADERAPLVALLREAREYVFCGGNPNELMARIDAAIGKEST